MTGSVDLTARQIMEVVPMVMRTLALEMRMAGHLPEAAHCPLLLLLAERPHNLSQLAVRHAVSLPTMSNSISTLVERGWVTRSRSPHDRRVVHVSLTPHGFAGVVRKSVLSWPSEEPLDSWLVTSKTSVVFEPTR